MRYHNITKCDMINGDGLRVVLWVAGCSHHCKGCHNPITWDPAGGLEFDQAAEDELFEELAQPYCSGITFSGGDPLYEGNREEVCRLICKVKKDYPSKTIWLYTGYKWEEVKDIPELADVDVVVDGEFVQDLANPQLHWVGSSNQRVLTKEDRCS